MSDQPIQCRACGKDLVPSGRNGQYRKTQRYCGPKCARTCQPIIYRPIEDRFKKRIIIENAGYKTPCWRWTGSFYTNGYGRIRDAGAKGKLWATHIYAYEQKHGPVPAGTELDHLCRNRWCCNPDHVEAVTHRVNALRGQAPAVLLHRSQQCKRGHEFNETNTYYYKHGTRKGRVAFCRVCKNERRSKNHRSPIPPSGN